MSNCAEFIEAFVSLRLVWKLLALRISHCTCKTIIKTYLPKNRSNFYCLKDHVYEFEVIYHVRFFKPLLHFRFKLCCSADDLQFLWFPLENFRGVCQLRWFSLLSRNKVCAKHSMIICGVWFWPGLHLRLCASNVRGWLLTIPWGSQNYM